MSYNKPLKIIHFISSLARGGRERQLASIVSNSDFMKHSTKIIYLNERVGSYIEEYGLGKYSIKIQAKNFWNRLKELNALIKQEKPELVYTWGNLESIFILLLNPFHKLIFINGSIRHGIRSNNFSQYLRTLILHLSPHVVSNSYAGLKANNIKRGKILYNGVSQNINSKLSAQEKLARRKLLLKVASEKTVLISVANFVPYKDYISILKTLQLINENYDFLYVILGSGPLENEIKNHINIYGLEDKIILAGNVENVHDYLQIADIFLHSSRGEGCSNAILEAMAAGLPVIASDTGGTSEIVTSDNSILFKYKNINQLKEGIENLLINPEKRKFFGENSKKIVKEKFSIQQMMNEYYKIINEIANS